MVTHLFRIGLSIWFLLTISCLATDPYKDFEDQLQNRIGESMDGAPLPAGRARPDLAFTKPLSNGNLEYHHAYENLRGLCRYVLVVDPTTGKIVDWRYDGADRDKACFTAP
jgi:hypothetical protein